MNILIVAIHYPVASGRYAADAFRRLGHDVRTLGDTTLSLFGAQVEPRYMWQSDGALPTAWDDWTPDLIVLMDSAFAYHHPVYQDVPHVVFGVDNHVRDYRQPGIARYFLAHKAASMMPWADDMEHLPCGYDPEVFTPSAVPFELRQWDVAIVGVMYPQRIEALNALSKAGLKVVGAQGLLYDLYRTTYQNARLSLCVSARGDLAMRVFETAAMGCIVLSDAVADLEAMKPDGVLFYHNADELVAVAKAALADPKAARVARAAAAWAAPHTWDARCARIVEWWGETYGAG